jgi:hypothetical protein
VNAWREAAQQGLLGNKRFQIPVYDSESWLQEAADLHSSMDSRDALKSKLYGFYQAASLHRQYVVRELLPSKGLLVA